MKWCRAASSASLALLACSLAGLQDQAADRWTVHTVQRTRSAEELVHEGTSRWPGDAGAVASVTCPSDLLLALQCREADGQRELRRDDQDLRRLTRMCMCCADHRRIKSGGLFALYMKASVRLTANCDRYELDAPLVSTLTCRSVDKDIHLLPDKEPL